MEQQQCFDVCYMQTKYTETMKKCQELESKIEKKDELLRKLKLVSEGVYEEYGDLKRRYDVESEVAAEAMKRASMWYRENKALKRRSMLILQQATRLGNVTFTDFDISENEENNDEENDIILNFQRTIEKIKEELSSLRNSLDLKKVQEIELKEKVEYLRKKLEEETHSHQITLKNLHEAQYNVKQFKRVSMLAVEEFEELHLKYLEEADLVKRLSSDKGNGNDCSRASILETNYFSAATDSTDSKEQKSVEEVEAEVSRVWEKKLTHLKQCVIDAENRAFIAEQQVTELKDKIKSLEEKLQKRASSLVPIPPPPPPPPPPLPSHSLNPIWSLMNLIGGKKKHSLKSATKKEENLHQRVMDETIDKIKKGDFLLKPVKEESSFSKSLPPAMSEMKNILNSLQRHESERKTSEPENELEVILRQRRQKFPSPQISCPQKPINDAKDSGVEIPPKKNNMRKRPMMEQ